MLGREADVVLVAKTKDFPESLITDQTTWQKLQDKMSLFLGVVMCDMRHGTVEPRFNEPLFNEVLDISNERDFTSWPKLQ